MQLTGDRLTLSPSDLNDYVECEHLTALAVEVARGVRARPHVANEYGELLRRKGEEHEQAYLERYQAEGRRIVDPRPADPWDFNTAARATAEAMREGADIIYQATFVDGDWRGRADFLERIEAKTALGAWGYEPVDAKLARAEKPTYVLQLCFYSEGVGRIQGEIPERMHVLLGPGERRTLRYADFAAYYRRVRSGLERAIATPRGTEPYPVEHCDLCEFREVCTERWNAQDHLSLVANIRRGQVTRLRASGIDTLARLAETPPGVAVDRVAPETVETLRDQARLQLARRQTGRLDWHALEPEPGCGFEALPQPSPGDLFFDIEGDPFWEPARGLHFLFGLLSRGESAWQYQTIWAHDRTQERVAFERLIDFFHERLAAHPDMHVYHFGVYESTAIKQLMGVYATREVAVDDLLRHEVFVNLHTVVRQALRAGVPGYSLKEVEALAHFERAAAIRSGTRAVLDYERWMAAGEQHLLEGIATYNEEDCRATLALRDWLLAERPADARWAVRDVEGEQDDERRTADAERETLRQALLAGGAPGSARWLAAELLEYHRREARPGWWWYYARLDHMSLDELVGDSEAIGRLTADGTPPVPAKQSLEWRLCFPSQQHKLSPGDAPFDPATKGGAGTIQKIDDAKGILVLRRGPKLTDVPLPAALVPGGPLKTAEQRAALARLAASVLDGDARYAALKDILARARPRLLTGSERDVLQATDLEEIRRVAAGLDGSYLFIQGPPGTGKTWTGARIIVDLMRRGRRVGIAATSHKAIHNMLDEVERAALAEGLSFRGLKKSTKNSPETVYRGTSITSADDVAGFAGARPELLLFAGTAWLFAHKDLDGGTSPMIDTLVIDEAGQVSLADALAMGTAARNVIFLGDPLQLAQVSQGTHPEGTDASVLEHLLGEHATIPPDLGIFLERTRRMHPDVCRFVSEIVYDSRLAWIPATEGQATAFGTGLRYLSVDHTGNVSAAPEEAQCVAARIGAMLGAPWTTADADTRPLAEADFMVVAPYNAQVRCLRAALDAAGLRDVQAGTVDKFQGREAAVVFYSMATSSADDVPRSLEFLFSRNRFNVAVSRAKCLAYLAASPRLLESRARTVEQMRLINALCRFVEMARA